MALNVMNVYLKHHEILPMKFIKVESNNQIHASNFPGYL